MPPITTMKIMYADHCTLKMASGFTLSELTVITPPAAPHPAAETR